MAFNNGSCDFNLYAYYKQIALCTKTSQCFLHSNATSTYCDVPDMDIEEFVEGVPLKTVRGAWQIYILGVSMLYFCGISEIATTWILRMLRSNSTLLRYFVEFITIAIPAILSVNIANWLQVYCVALITVGILALAWRMQCWQKIHGRIFKVDKRPPELTFVRSYTNLMTAVCILAIDFENFPKEMRKTRSFGVGLMDMGIGDFVFTMGCVSRRPRSASQLKRTLLPVGMLLLLGLARTVVIVMIDYHQDEHEYGKHLNAFFTLGLTKLIGTFLSGTVSSDEHLLPLGCGIVALHELALQLGVSDYVMDTSVERNTFWAANREGFCSLPGFVGIYIISIYISQWLQKDNTMSCQEFLHKLKSLTVLTGFFVLLALLSSFTVGIARVTCNFGYIAMVYSFLVGMITAFLFFFDLIMKTLWVATESNQLKGSGDKMDNMLKMPTASEEPMIPTLMHAVNNNGLAFFLLSNVLTGAVNIFLKPEDRSDPESIAILTVYMLIATGAIYILYKLKIRIA